MHRKLFALITACALVMPGTALARGHGGGGYQGGGHRSGGTHVHFSTGGHHRTSTHHAVAEQGGEGEGPVGVRLLAPPQRRARHD